MNNNLAIVLNSNFMPSTGSFNSVNIISTMSKIDVNKLRELFKKNIKIAVKPEKVKVAIGNLIIDSFEIKNDQNQMVIQKTYVATVKKTYIQGAVKFYNKFLELNSLIKSSEVDSVINRENDIFREMNVFNPSLNTKINNEGNANPISSFETLESKSVAEPENMIKPVDFGNPSLASVNNGPSNEKVNSFDQSTINSIPTFNANLEENLNGALPSNGEKEYDTSKINLNDIPSQTIDKTIATNEIGNSGHIKGKFVAFLVVLLFIGSCVFLGYEITKMNEVMPLIKDKYFS